MLQIYFNMLQTFTWLLLPKHANKHSFILVHTPVVIIQKHYFLNVQQEFSLSQ